MMTIEADYAALEADFKTLTTARGDEVQPHEALEIARRYPRAAALSGAIATYVIGYRVKPDQPITAKDPMKAGLALKFSKAVRFENCDHLTSAYELAFTQTAYEREAKLIAMVPFLNASLQDHFDRGLSRRDFTLISEVAVWSAKFVTDNLIKDVAAIGRAMRR
ncbi:hypothetical protein [Brevundimonas sp.]|uniref:hypothetical protein n=1 Tax=Brevundimonas sp. TaxID=1871086 RepID=UPI0028977884|nr:hypothetical protein [Brevundimonas sp.]